MPLVAITEGNAPAGRVERFARLKLDTNARALVSCLQVDPDPTDPSKMVLKPWFEYVHRLQKVVVVDGLPQKEERKTKNGTVIDWKYAWVGTPICLGDIPTVRAKGIDPANCPVCAASEQEPEAISAPEPRYAMNVVRWPIQPGTFNIAAPSPMVLVWSLTAARFAKLYEIQREVAADGLGIHQVDLKLGPCKDAGFQNYDISYVPGRARWQQIPEAVALVRQVWTAPGGRATDEQLEAECGRRVINREWLQRDIAQVLEAWRRTRLGDTPASDPFGGSLAGANGQQDMVTGLTGLQAQAAAAPAVPAAPEPAADPMAGLFGSPAQAPATAPQSAPAPAADPLGALLGGGPPAAPAPAAEPLPPGGLEHFAAPAPAAPAEAAPAPQAAPAPATGTVPPPPGPDLFAGLGTPAAQPPAAQAGEGDKTFADLVGLGGP